MDPKDKTYLKSKFKDEFDAICKTEFWKDYVVRLDGERKSASRHCETDMAEDVPRYQGMVRAIDVVIGLPLKVLEVAPKKPQEGK